MNITVRTKDFKTAIKNLIPVTRSSLQILYSAKLEADENGITIWNTDLSTIFFQKLEGVVHEKGSVLIRLEVLKNISKSLKGETVSIKLMDGLLYINDLSLELEGDVNDYVAEPEKGDRKLLCALTEQELKNVSKMHTGANLNIKFNPTRVSLQGIHFGKDYIRFVPTDGHTLKMYSFKKECNIEGLENFNNIFGECYADSINIDETKHLSKLVGNCEVYKNGTSITFKTDTQYLSMILHGTPPSVDNIMPKEYSQTCVFDRKEMIETLESFSVVANKKTCLVAFDIMNNKILCENSDNGMKLEKIIEFKNSTFKNMFGVNYKYLVNILKHINTDLVSISQNVRIEDSGSIAPIRIDSVNTLSGIVEDEYIKEDYSIVMPLRLTDED